jgi:hypothetical protein
MPISKIKSSGIEADSVTGSNIVDGTVTSADLATNIDIAGTLDVTGATTLDSGLTVDANGATVLTVDRATSDGEIINLRKNGTTVGSISTEGNDLAIGNADAGLQFVDGAERVRPFNVSTNAATDGLLDLGDGNKRFKDLYLSGGVVFGATGGAVTSKTLDDYEEGTWTPAYSTSGGSFGYDSATQGQYTKIGNVVTVYFRIYTMSATVGTGDVTITGLPFAEAIPSGTGGGSIGDCRIFAGDTPSEIGVSGSSIYIWYRTAANGANTRLQASDLNTGSVANLIDGQITYITS